jgi:hypothetical protein
MLITDMQTEQLVENVWKSHRKNRTLDDLMNIQLEPSIKPVKAVIDPINPYNKETVIPVDKLQKAWILYNAYAPKGNKTVWAPNLNTISKKFRWKLYITLVKWGVI